MLLTKSDFTFEFLFIKKKLTDACLNLLSITGLVSLFGIFLHTGIVVNTTIIITYLCIYTAVVSITVFKTHVPLFYRKLFILCLFFFLSLYLFYAVGVIGISLLFLIIFTVLGGILFNQRIGLLCLGLASGMLVAFGILAKYKLIAFRDPYSSSSETWLSTTIIYVLLVGILLSVIELLHQHIGKLIKKLDEKHVELAKANHELDTFIYRVSHDLRSPILSSIGLIELTKNTKKEKDRRHYLDLQLTSLKKLDTFILNILEYSRNNNQEVYEEEIETGKFINNLIQAYEIDYPKVNQLQDVYQEIPFCSDPTRLAIILNNLLSNAFRFTATTSETPLVKVVAIVDREYLNIWVSDNGIGILPEYQAKVFDLFFRASDENHGTGVGLYIVRETVRKLNGRINLYSVPRKGTTVKVQIPNLFFAEKGA
ncbi:sensor histidine kinase [Sediminitomix flava]|uniref:histidine kinase n=1 Tax=Sediminitomix flava TaxID=379075 RepID=A0A315ZCU1_SEDFL|nr:HAMP domain-containing sensor histidine kinase [Sediminitomix flava]PWJ43371.1 signal transduction histidine kinase [Sediminitomix flava]